MPAPQERGFSQGFSTSLVCIVPTPCCSVQPQICCCVFEKEKTIHHLSQMPEYHCHNIQMETVFRAEQVAFVFVVNPLSIINHCGREEKRREELPDNEDGYSFTSSSSSKDRTSCSSKTFQQNRKKKRKHGLTSCTQEPVTNLSSKSMNLCSTQCSRYLKLARIFVSILTLSTSTCSSTRISLLMPVRNKNI